MRGVRIDGIDCQDDGTGTTPRASGVRCDEGQREGVVVDDIWMGGVWYDEVRDLRTWDERVG